MRLIVVLGDIHNFPVDLKLHCIFLNVYFNQEASEAGCSGSQHKGRN